MDSDPPLSRASRRDFIIAFLDVNEGDAADMRADCLRYLLSHEHADAVRHDVRAVAITGERQANLRHLVGVCRGSEG